MIAKIIISVLDGFIAFSMLWAMITDDGNDKTLKVMDLFVAAIMVINMLFVWR